MYLYINTTQGQNVAPNKGYVTFPLSRHSVTQESIWMISYMLKRQLSLRCMYFICIWVYLYIYIRLGGKHEFWSGLLAILFSSDSLLSHIRMHVSYHVYAQKTAICALYVLNLYIDVFSCMYTTRSKMWVSIRITWCFPPTLCMVHVNHGSLLTHDYRSLLQNIVSFLGLFCNRDLCIRIHVKTWVSIRITWCFPPTLCIVT